MPKRYPSYPYVEPVAANLSQPEIESIIGDLLENNPGVCLREGALDGLCRALNVDVEYSSPPHDLMLDVPLDKRAVIFLPRNGRPKHDRIAAAIGVGHWILHVPLTREKHPGCGVQALQTPKDPAAQQEARRFALTLLMPEVDFRELWYEGRAGAVADVLNVPTQVVYERASMLDLTQPDDSGGGRYEWKERPALGGY
ncbi:ImmA/IrrE family metallo-endopeptidase [Sagittula salina]|uniref:ImmA/IrrE family metallo-endopeptidase n=1 Tax=Sagittula salina TaxID=2820268 RepID=A0A940MNZ6_9RHOB|nr:ImmA/IrrE family metallo-endopeptidase [Sagittula salina]MBP0481497.1 ImmA/IrrE family metallo-endopeptidase [Sagittula salina]